MARRPPAAGSSVLPQQTPRQNEYFVPRDGIDREVITADICRYLGNDALVRPGNYEVLSPATSLQPRLSCWLDSTLTCHISAEPRKWPNDPRLFHQRLPKLDLSESFSSI